MEALVFFSKWKTRKISGLQSSWCHASVSNMLLSPLAVTCVCAQDKHWQKTLWGRPEFSLSHRSFIWHLEEGEENELFLDQILREKMGFIPILVLITFMQKLEATNIISNQQQMFYLTGLWVTTQTSLFMLQECFQISIFEFDFSINTFCLPNMTTSFCPPVFVPQTLAKCYINIPH